MKKKTLNILFTALVSMTLIGCGNTNTESNASASASESVTASIEAEESKEVVVAEPTPAPTPSVTEESKESKEEVPESSETLPEESKAPEENKPVETEAESKAPEESKETPAPTATPAPTPTPTPQPEKQPEVTPAPTPAPTPEPTPAPTPEPTPAPAVCTHPNTTQTNNDYQRTISGGCCENHHAWTKTCTNCGAVTETGDMVMNETHNHHHEEETIAQANCTSAGRWRERSWCDCGAQGTPDWVTHDVPASGHHYEEVLGNFENPLQGGRGQQWINKCRDCGDVAGERWDASE